MGGVEKNDLEQIVSINGIETALTATLNFTKLHETETVIYNMPRNILDLTSRSTVDSIIVKRAKGDYVSVFDAGIRQISAYSCNTVTVTLRSTNAFIGDTGLSPVTTFEHFDLKVTDGYELIGVCPYNVNRNDLDMIVFLPEVNIPVKMNSIIAETEWGKWIFNAAPNYKFSRDALTLGFDQRIHFDSIEPLSFGFFRSMFRKFTSFLQILGGELVTVNELRLYDEEDIQRRQSYEFIGHTNFPLDRLRLLKGNGMDTTWFLRKSIFKISDFQEIGTALNTWFTLEEQLSLANGAYERILLDGDVNIVTVNGFLAAMQLVEGYSSVFSQVEADREEFEIIKERLIAKCQNEEEKGFLEKYCSYSGETFRKMLKEFTFEGLNVLSPQSKSRFDKIHDSFISKIKNERDVDTHSSTTIEPTFERSKLASITTIYKHFYRINILLQLGLSPDEIRQRLFLNRKFRAVIEDYFGVSLEFISENENEMSFDSLMRYFSQTK